MNKIIRHAWIYLAGLLLGQCRRLCREILAPDVTHHLSPLSPHSTHRALSPHIFIIIPDPILYYGGVQKVLICSLFNWLGVWWLLPMQLGSPHPPSSLVGSCIMKFAYFKDPLGLFLPLLTAHTNIYAHQTHIYTHQTHTHTQNTDTHTDKPSTQTHTPT